MLSVTVAFPRVQHTHTDFVDLMCREEDIKNIGKSHYRHNNLREEIAALGI